MADQTETADVSEHQIDVTQVTYEQYVTSPERYSLPLHEYYTRNSPRIWKAMQEADLAWCVVSVNDGEIINSCPQAQLQSLPTPEDNLKEGKRLDTVAMLFMLPRHLWNPEYTRSSQRSSYRGDPNDSDD